MADVFDDLLSSELVLLFFVSIAVWILIFIYIYYTNIRLKRLEKELYILKDD
ncbi:MAG: CcmD family protein [Candidatus Hodarchaeota archaeon]